MEPLYRLLNERGVTAENGLGVMANVNEISMSRSTSPSLGMMSFQDLREENSRGGCSWQQARLTREAGRSRTTSDGWTKVLFVAALV